MYNLLMFGIINHILQLSFGCYNIYSIAMISVQTVIFIIGLFKRNEVTVIGIRVLTIVCTVLNSVIIQRPISYMACGYCFMMAMETWWTCFISGVALFFMALTYDIDTISEIIGFIIVTSIYLYYFKKSQNPIPSQSSDSTHAKLAKDVNKYSFEIAVSPNKDQDCTEFNLYRHLLKSFPDGVLIIDEQYQCQFCNESFKLQMKEKAQELAFQKLLDLKNAIDNQQNEYEQLFRILDKRIRSKQYSMEEQIQGDYIKLRSAVEQEEQMVLDLCIGNYEEKTIHNLSQSPDVNLQVKEIFKQMAERELKNINILDPSTQSIKFYDQISMICEDLNKKIYHLIMKPYKVQHNKNYLIIVIRDITHINQMAQLENKSMMLYQVAHEFKTPLGLIINCANSINPYVEHKQKVEFINPIKSMAGSLLSLVHDLLDVAQLKVGKFNLQCNCFNIIELMTEITDMMRPQAEEKNLYMKLQYDSTVPSVIISDANRIKQVVMNLLSNAIKFTSKGGIIITIKSIPHFVEIIVTDTGIGIQANEQKKLFSAFGRVDNVYNPTGVGLGLMISNILAQKLGQEIQLYSEGQGKGSRFSFRIQNQQDEVDSDDQCYNDPEEEGILSQQLTVPQLALSIGDTVRTRCKCPYILVIDDQPFNCKAFEILLKSKGWKIDKAFSGLEGLQCIDNYKGCGRHQSYRIIFLDLEMPGMNGYDTSTEIKKRGVKSVIVVCSGHPKNIIDMSYFDDYIEKPIQLPQLNKLLSRVLLFQ